MKVQLDAKVLPFLAALAPASRRAIHGVLKQLGDDPSGRPASLHVKALDLPETPARHFRIRVGDYRVVYLVEAGAIRVLRVFHRDEGYGWLEALDRPKNRGAEKT
jgi:mRNA-degrading endonuclease RelE of RelBE toxin-antitoxin system